MNDAAREHNRNAWNARVRKKGRFTKPAADEDLRDPSSRLDTGWLGSNIAGLRLLCLASGGGRQSAWYAAAGAKVTVVDISSEMLALDRQVAAERKLDIQAVEASMDDLSALPEAAYDIVVQPVSSCYLPDVTAIYRQVARVIVPGGLYISQHKQPASMQADVSPTSRGYELLVPQDHEGPLPAVVGSRHREEGTLEFLHCWDDLIGGLCRAGFVIEDLFEPRHGDPKADRGSFGHRSRYVPPYVRIKARRLTNKDGASRKAEIVIVGR